MLTDEGLPYQDGDDSFRLFEQSSIVGIIAQPVPDPNDNKCVPMTMPEFNDFAAN